MRRRRWSACPFSFAPARFSRWARKCNSPRKSRPIPLEIRIYRGADGDFTLYEDENDTYNYEKGAYATVGFHWDDAKQTLTIGERKGAFPGIAE